MQQVKLFTSVEGNTQNLEQEINDWIASSGVQVMQVIGNIAPQSLLNTIDPSSLLSTAQSSTRRFAPSDIFVIILYEAP